MKHVGINKISILCLWGRDGDFSYSGWVELLPATVTDCRRKCDAVYGAGGMGNGVAFTHADGPRMLTARTLK